MPKKMFFRPKRVLIAGLIIIIPVWISVLALRTVAGWITGTFALLPASLQPRTYIPVYGVEILVALLIVGLVGLAANNLFGRKLIQAGERILARIPVLKTVYQGVKHLTTGIMSENKIFSEVVLLEFPIKGISFIGFVTGEAPPDWPGATDGRYLKIFIPTTPNPTSGFFCVAAEKEVRRLPISVDDAFKLIISAGYANLGGGPSPAESLIDDHPDL